MSNLTQLSQQVTDQLADLQGKKVVIFGDIGIDEYVQGSVHRISPEAPVPVVEVQDSNKKLGLAANVAANVKSLGGEPQLFSLIGDDDGAQTLKELMKDQGLSTDCLITDASRSTTKKLRVMSGHHHVVRVDYETKAPVDPEVLASHQKRLEQAIASADCVVLQDYAKGLVSENASQLVIAAARRADTPVIVDPYRNTPLRFYRGASFMTPNRDEALELAKQIPKPEIWSDINAIGRELMESLESSQMVITMGADGMSIFDGDEAFQLPTFARKVFDVTGAGDTVIAAFALGVAAGWNLRQSGVLANLAAGVVVGQIGAVSCSIEAIRASVSNL